MKRIDEMDSQMKDMRDVLEAVARALRKPVRPCEFYDSNVCDFEVGQGWQPVATSGSPFSRQIAFQRLKRKITIYADREFASIWVKGDRDGPVFCVGKPRRLHGARELTRHVIDNRSWPVYVGDDPKPNEIESALRSPSLQAAVAELLKSDSATLHLECDLVRLYFQPRDPATLIAAIEPLLSLVGAPKERSIPSDAKLLPKGLQKLVPLMKRWAESDDADRVQLLEQASKRSLEKLVESVEPHLAEIDHYLNKFGSQPMPEAATALGTLAECALEARLLLASKAKT